MMERIRKTGGFEVETKVETMGLATQSFHCVAKNPVEKESPDFLTPKRVFQCRSPGELH